MPQHLLVILAYTDSRDALKVDWQHIAETLSRVGVSVGPAVYRTPGGDISGSCVLGIICAIDSEITLPECPEIKLILGSSLGGNIDIRIYETLPSGAQISVPTSLGKHFVVLNGMTPNDIAEQTFNDWYAEEHVPMLRAVPGWRSSSRFRLLTASEKPPRYLALHEWETCDAFGTPEFKAATNTPWRARVVVEQVNKKERYLLEYLGAVEELKRTS
ncbi:hypothetical protein B0H19DRAFT_1089394 [Mycena capillaripes]|nr:hypothetical protein B0H19DRAFT_1089394 [Mycena capillaripes]